MKTMNQRELTEKRDLAEKSFMLGVNWLLKVLEDGHKTDPGIWETFTESTSDLLRQRAKSAIESVGK